MNPLENSDELIRQAMRHYRPPQPRPDFVEALHDRLLDQLPPQDFSAGPNRRPWRTVRWLGGISTAAAAILLIAVLFYRSQPPLSFASVLRHLEQVRTIEFSTKLGMAARSADGKDIHPYAEAHSWYDKDLGVRTDLSIRGTLVLQTYIPWKGPMLLVDHLNHNASWLQPDQQLRRRLAQVDPAALIVHLREHAAAVRSAGYQVLADGSQTAAFEVDGRSLGLPTSSSAQIWVDPASQLPSRLVCPIGNGGLRLIVLAENFQWDSEIDARTIQLTAPPGYRVSEHPSFPNPSEPALLDGLRRFAAPSGGYYPGSLAAWPLLGKLTAILPRAAHALPPGEPQVNPEDRQLLTELLSGLLFYVDLILHDAWPEYFGDCVTSAQADQVLMRWQLPGDALRIVYGDLRVETAGAARNGQPASPTTTEDH